MGMAASQARMLSLTSRMSDLEYAAQNISNAKLALATSSQNASAKYLAALDQKKLTVKNPDNNTYVNATASNLTSYNAISKMDIQRFLKNSAGQVLISQEVATAYENAKKNANPKGLADTWLSTSAITSPSDQTKIDSNGIYQGETIDFINAGYVTVNELSAYDKGMQNGEELFLNSFTDGTSKLPYTNSVFLTSIPTGTLASTATTQQDKVGKAYYEAEFAEIEECGYQVIPDGKENDSEWLYEQLNNGTMFISEKKSGAGKDGKDDFVDISWSSGDATLVTADDKEGLARAEAEYEATNTEIATKDKRFDVQLKSIDTEHTAIQTELESVKKVIDKNIDRTFKIFDA